ncbi:MAG: tetratricopeptide repeat protein [Nitrospirae bacterium]|jgi:tetratricopeptide (TPR) repeat protein|nr:tetratricopeptide repeat protein [Nitrospirota bacterium]
MPDTELESLLNRGLEALNSGDTLSALVFFEKALKMENSPAICSYFALCISKERGQFSKAISLCEEEIKREPENTDVYLNLGRIYLFQNKREEAVKVFRDGLSHGINQQIIDELNKLGTRKPPVISFLKRSNPINKYLGIILKRLGLR